MDVSKTPFIQSTEMFWILQLKTVFPYGFNNFMGYEPKTEDTYVLAG